MIANAHATQNNSLGARFLGAAPAHARTSIQPDISFATQVLDADFIERIDGHLEIGEVDTGTIGLDPNLGVGIDNSFNGYHDFHNQHLTRWNTWGG
jgi:hypothetical protein